VVGGTIIRTSLYLIVVTHHLPLTLIRQVISGSSLGPAEKALPKGSRISRRVESGEIAISVSGTGVGEGAGE
jgi:hypothetical protein